MFWRIVSVAVLLSLLHVSMGSSVNCTEKVTCEECTNVTECLWLKCQADQVRCISKNANTTTCTVVNCTTPTLTPPTPTNSTATTTITSTSTINPNATSVSTSSTTNPTTTSNNTVTSLPPSPHKTSTFDAASFIGGIVLVLGLQAVVFFLYKFCRSKDRNYHTL